MYRRHGAGRFIKGMGTGLAAGMTIYAVGSVMLKNKKNVSRNAGRAIKAVGSFIDNVQYMMK
ncbi:MAG TPA: hypothetical protein DEQ02_05720 [Ruminococcaceae bacterium]|nr:hypothetical protein [Oscillospiraceae bacterium]